MKVNNLIIEKVLDNNRSYLGKHFSKYRNHVYRVFIMCQKLDNNPANIDKYAIASVFHDIGIWTDNTFDYLQPSIVQAAKYLTEEGKLEWLEEVSVMIDMHHKWSRYRGLFELTVETFRRADWIDVTKGRKTFGLNKIEIIEATQEYPKLSFHRFLVMQTIKNFFKSPLNPLPMFKK